MNLEEIKRKIDEHKPFIEKEFKVASISVFGSYLREEQNKESDIDILVEFYDIIDLFKFVELEYFLSDILGKKVDLVMKDTSWKLLRKYNALFAHYNNEMILPNLS